MKREEYLEAVEDTKKYYKKDFGFGDVIASVIILIFVAATLWVVSNIILRNEEYVIIATGIGVFVAICILLCLKIRKNKEIDQTVMQIYAREIPVDCPNCGGKFSVIAGNTEVCPYCGTGVLSDNWGNLKKAE